MLQECKPCRGETVRARQVPVNPLDMTCSHPRNTAVSCLQALTQDIAGLLRFSRLRSGRPRVPALRAPRARSAGPVTDKRGTRSHPLPAGPFRADSRCLSCTPRPPPAHVRTTSGPPQDRPRPVSGPRPEAPERTTRPRIRSGPRTSLRGPPPAPGGPQAREARDVPAVGRKNRQPDMGDRPDEVRDGILRPTRKACTAPGGQARNSPPGAGVRLPALPPTPPPPSTPGPPAPAGTRTPCAVRGFRRSPPAGRPPRLPPSPVRAGGPWSVVGR